MLSNLAVLLLSASSALAGVIQIRQEGYNVTAHANSATAGLLAPGYTGFYWPEGRGYNRSTHREFCGGFPTGARTDFPLTGGMISLVQQKAVSNVRLSYSTVSDPTSFDQFVPASSNLTALGVGLSCVQAPDFSALGLGSGATVTLYLEYVYGSHQFSYYQCADVLLVPDEQFIAKPMCINSMVTQADAEMMANGTINAATANWDGTSFNDDSGLSSAAAGGIGAGVTLAVLALLLAALAFVGLLTFGKKNTQVSENHQKLTAESIDSGSFRREKV